MDYWLTYSAVAGLGIGGWVLILLAARRWICRGFLRKFIINGGLSLISLFIAFMAAELFFKLFFAQTDDLNFTLASKNWFERYWQVNSLGYRDVEWTREKLENKTKIIIVGDSFTAGYGIKNVEDRFANVLAHKLGDDYAVMVVAENGTETGGEIERIKAYPYAPDILILQYYINDIEDAARKKNMQYSAPKLYPPPALRSLVKNSYALNFLYWRSVRLGPHIWQNDYLSWVQSIYDDPNIWWLHQQELLTIYEGALAERIDLIVVVFPALTNVEETRDLTARVVNLFDERNVPTLDVAELVENMPPQELVVSPLDAHPNEWLHAKIADELYQMVLQIQ